MTVKQVGDTISINFVIPTEFKVLPGVKVYEFDYGDSLQTTENISDITIPLVISYNAPGPVWPTLRARNQDGTIVSVSNYIVNVRRCNLIMQVQNIMMLTHKTYQKIFKIM